MLSLNSAGVDFYFGLGDTHTMNLLLSCRPTSEAAPQPNADAQPSVCIAHGSARARPAVFAVWNLRDKGGIPSDPVWLGFDPMHSARKSPFSIFLPGNFPKVKVSQVFFHTDFSF